ncbi:MAG: hypothetical protein MJH09_10820, partial [Cetobacterium sp.]|nr:hypothetical protein [Cetobacterium sp.]
MSNKENTMSTNKKTDETIKTSVNKRVINSIDEDILFKISKEVAEEAFKINHMKTAREINAENEAKKLVKTAIKEGLLESIDK